MRLLLTKADLGDLCVCKHADDDRVLLQPLQLVSYALAIAVLLGILCESLLLRLIPAEPSRCCESSSRLAQRQHMLLAASSCAGFPADEPVPMH